MKVSKKQINRNKKQSLKQIVDFYKGCERLHEASYETRVDSIKEYNPTIYEMEQELRLNPTSENITLLKDICEICNIRVQIYNNYSCRYWVVL